MDIPLKCNCGAVRGTAKGVSPSSGTRLVCCCDDCQTFARHLGRDDILDEYGGTDIFQIAPARVEIDRGRDRLRCIKLTPKSLLRWYTGCCNTPIGNTVSAGVPYVGMVHNFMDTEGARDRHLGPVLARVHTRFATNPPPPERYQTVRVLRVFLRAASKLLSARMRGLHRPSPLFNADGTPVATPRILSGPGER